MTRQRNRGLRVLVLAALLLVSNSCGATGTAHRLSVTSEAARTTVRAQPSESSIRPDVSRAAALAQPSECSTSAIGGLSAALSQELTPTAAVQWREAEYPRLRPRDTTEALVGTIYYGNREGFWKLTLPEGHLSRLAETRSSSSGLELSPDGKWLTYYDSIPSEALWPRQTALWLISTTGEEPVKVSNEVPMIASVEWKDGWIYYTELTDFGRSEQTGDLMPARSMSYAYNPAAYERRPEPVPTPVVAVTNPESCRPTGWGSTEHGEVEICSDGDGHDYLSIVKGRDSEPIRIPGIYSGGEAAWSPDGHWLAYSGTDSNGRPQPFVWERGSERVQQIADSREEHSLISPSWSPDGRFLAFQPGVWWVCVYEVAEQRLSYFRVYIILEGGDIEWSPDSQAILVSSDRLGRAVMGDKEGAIDLFVIRVPGGDVIRVTDGGGTELSYAWVP